MKVQEKPIGFKGKYGHRMVDSTTGLWYAKSDFTVQGRLRAGALPSPVQDTPEKTSQSRALHILSANKLMEQHGLLIEPDETPVMTPRARLEHVATWCFIAAAATPTTVVMQLLRTFVVTWNEVA